MLKIFCTSMTKEEKGKNAAMSSCLVVRPTDPMENSFHALGLDESGAKKPAQLCERIAKLSTEYKTIMIPCLFVGEFAPHFA